MSQRVTIPETRKFVLSVNDNQTMGKELYDWLTQRGVVIVRARSTSHALDLLDRFTPDVVITNLRRMEGLAKNEQAGIELAASIRRRGLNVPIVLYTMNVPEYVKHKAKQAGVSHVTVIPSELKTWLAYQL